MIMQELRGMSFNKNHNLNERYTDFFKFAFNRIIESVSLYEREAKKTKDQTKRIFLFYLAGKKRVQHVILEMMAQDSSLPIDLFKNECNSFLLDFYCGNASLADKDINDIVNVVQESADKEFNLFMNLSALEEEIETKKLLITLVSLSKEFSECIGKGFEQFRRQSFKGEILDNFEMYENEPYLKMSNG